MRMLGHVGRAHRAPLAEQDAEDAVVTGQVADLGSRLLVDPRRDEALQVCAAAVQYPQRRIARSDSPAAVSTVF